MENFRIFLLVGIIVLSGCLGQPPNGGTGSSNGVIIKQFYTDFDEVHGEEPVQFTLTVENVGEADATDVRAEIFGGIHENAGWVFDSSTPSFQSLPTDSLRRADPSNKIQGESYDFQWIATAPTLSVDNTYTADTRVYFKYSTSSVLTLKFITNDYIRTLSTAEADKLKKTAGVTSVKTSGAPLQLSATVGNSPLIVYNNVSKYALQFIITNVGSGSVFRPTLGITGSIALVTGQAVIPNTDLFYADMTITTGGLDMTCPGFTLSDTNTLKGSILLSSGKTKALFCKISNVNKDDIRNTKDYVISADLNYGYFVDSSTSIKVLKTEGA